MPGRIVRPAAVLGIAGALAGATFAQPAASAAPQARAAARHVLLISVDGLHQSDLAWYVARNPQSALARLVNGGVDYTDASTTEPSDSFPGMVAQVTGGGPGTTGVYYDDTLQRGAAARGHDAVQGRQARRRGGPHRGPGPRQGVHRRRPGPQAGCRAASCR